MRIALGAEPARVIRLALREAILLVGVGLAAGAGLALWVGQAAAVTCQIVIHAHGPR